MKYDRPYCLYFVDIHNLLLKVFMGNILYTCVQIEGRNDNISHSYMKLLDINIVLKFLIDGLNFY